MPVDKTQTTSEYKCEKCGELFEAPHYGELEDFSILQYCGQTATWQRNVKLIVNAHLVVHKQEQEEVYPDEQG